MVIRLQHYATCGTRNETWGQNLSAEWRHYSTVATLYFLPIGSFVVGNSLLTRNIITYLHCLHCNICLKERDDLTDTVRIYCYSNRKYSECYLVASLTGEISF